MELLCACLCVCVCAHPSTGTMRPAQPGRISVPTTFVRPRRGLSVCVCVCLYCACTMCTQCMCLLVCVPRAHKYAVVVGLSVHWACTSGAATCHPLLSPLLLLLCAVSPPFRAHSIVRDCDFVSSTLASASRILACVDCRLAWPASPPLLPPTTLLPFPWGCWSLPRLFARAFM